MALRTFVKISQVNNLSDARYCAGMGVAMLGFNLEPGTVHYVAPEKFRELSEWVAGVSFVGEFTNASPDTILRLIGEYPVEYLQTDVAEHLEQLQQLNLPLILRIPVTGKTTQEAVEQILDSYQNLVAFFLLEASEQIGINRTLRDKLLQLSSKYPLVVDLGGNSDTIPQMLDAYPLKGIALKGGEEIRAGYKDFDELAEILESLEVDEAY
jgi:phosphoribosylanthranilate isomerase